MIDLRHLQRHHNAREEPERARCLKIQRQPHISVTGQKRPYFDLILWACLATGSSLPASIAPVTLGNDSLPRGVQIIAASFEDRTAIACAAMLEQLGAGFRAPPIKVLTA
jgi:Asp-tRNA(Asn)/Glu-tRNA(Gln) amidotransferase A subunit family amidase